MEPNQTEKLRRRQFLSNSFLAGVTCCIGCSHLFSNLAYANEPQPTTDFKDRISLNAERTYNQIFTFAYRDAILPQLIELSNEIGRDKLIEMLEKSNGQGMFTTWIRESA